MLLSAAICHTCLVLSLMETVAGEGENSDVQGVGQGQLVFFSRPNRSLSHTQQRTVFWGMAVLCFGIAAVFAALGYWLMLPFAGLEIGLLAWAFETLREHDGDYESITFAGDKLILEWCVGNVTRRRELNRHWAHIACECGQGNYNCRLSFRSHGMATEFGQYLSDQNRQELAARIRELCRDN